MFTPPADIDGSDRVAALVDGWGCDAVTLEYLAVGFGSHHWRSTTASTAWFVTVDDLVAKRREPDEAVPQTRARLVAALATAAELGDAGYEFVVAPVRTDGGQIVWSLSDRYVVAVYPLMQGQAHDYGHYPDAAHRDAVVCHVAALHRSPEDCRRQASTETFSIAPRADLLDSYSQLQVPWAFGPFAEPARRLLSRNMPMPLHERSTRTTRWGPRCGPGQSVSC